MYHGKSCTFKVIETQLFKFPGVTQKEFNKIYLRCYYYRLNKQFDYLCNYSFSITFIIGPAILTDCSFVMVDIHLTFTPFNSPILPGVRNATIKRGIIRNSAMVRRFSSCKYNYYCNVTTLKLWLTYIDFSDKSWLGKISPIWHRIPN